MIEYPTRSRTVINMPIVMYAPNMLVSFPAIIAADDLPPDAALMQRPKDVQWPCQAPGQAIRQPAQSLRPHCFYFPVCPFRGKTGVPEAVEVEAVAKMCLTSFIRSANAAPAFPQTS
jgi:hypothetical protein